MLMCPAVKHVCPTIGSSVKLLGRSRLSNRCQNRSLTLCLLETGLFIHWASCNVSCWKLLVHINFFFLLCLMMYSHHASRWHHIVVPKSPWSGPDGSLDAQLNTCPYMHDTWQCWCNHRNALVINRWCRRFLPLHHSSWVASHPTSFCKAEPSAQSWDGSRSSLVSLFLQPVFAGRPVVAWVAMFETPWFQSVCWPDLFWIPGGSLQDLVRACVAPRR